MKYSTPTVVLAACASRARDIVRHVPYIVLLVTVVLAGCRDEPTAPRVNHNPPAAFRIAAPDTILQGRSFDVTITALDETGAPADEWAGPVSLESSAGTISPATAQIDAGSVTVQVTIEGHAGEVTLLAANGPAESDPLTLMVLSGAAPARIEIVPSTALLTAAGETHAFAVRAFDAQGAPTVVDEVQWTTSNAATLAIADNGVATAMSDVGSAQLVASADGVVSAPALVLVASPAPGAVLLPDSQIVGDPVPVDPAAPYGVGWQYRTRIRGTAPDIGSLVIGTGDRPLAGRVVSVAAVGAEQDITVEIVPVNQLFSALEINAEIPLVEAAPTAGTGARRTQGGVHHALADIEFERAGFSCKASGSVPFELPEPDPDVNGSLVLQLDYGEGLERFVIVGDLSAEIEYRPMLTAAFEGKLECDRAFKTFRLPITGWLSVFIGLQVPIGIGFELDGKIEVADIGFDVKAGASAHAELGFVCPGGGACSGVLEFDSERDGSFDFISPEPSEQFKVELGLHGFLFSNLEIGWIFTDDTFEMYSAKAGLKQSVDLATMHEQVSDTTYASEFALKALVTAGAGEGLTGVVEKLAELMGDENFEFEPNFIDDTTDIAHSPAGTFTITPESVAPGDSSTLGDMATFRVELDSVEYLGLQSVDRVEFFWRHDSVDGDFTLGPARPACTDVAASKGQRTFECQTDFLGTTPGEQTFYAFVHSRLFGVPLPVPLEISPNAKATVNVAVTCNAQLPDYEEWGTPGVTVTTSEDDGGGSVTAEVIAAEPNHLSYRASIAGNSSGAWVSARGDLEVNDFLLIQPLEPHSGFLTLHVHTSMRAEQSAPDPFVTTDAEAFNYLVSKGVDLEGRAEDPLVMTQDTTVSVILDNDGRAIEGGWIPFRHYAQAYVRTRHQGNAGNVSIESRMDILDYATDEAGRSIPIQICSAIGASY